MKKILIIIGTRPEAVKLAPVIIRLRQRPEILTRVCVTAQHREMLDQVLRIFGIVPDVDLNLMQRDQTLAELTAGVCRAVDEVLARERPDFVLVQGDTTTVMAAALCAFYRRIRVGHVEAGLRSGDLHSPFPEEMNRRVAGIISHLHFAPTQRAADVLRSEGVPPERIFLTGNPVIDALRMVVGRPAPDAARTLLERTVVSENGRPRKLVLVTAHRRENFGERFESLCMGLKALVERNRDIAVIYPVHLNPHVRGPVYGILGEKPRIFLTDPADYDVLAHLMKAAWLVLTDSGGIQEEAPSLGKPVLVMRTETERPEGIEAGTAMLVGPFAENIVRETEALLGDEARYARMARAVNPYGDGHAAERIVGILLAALRTGPEEPVHGAPPP